MDNKRLKYVSAAVLFLCFIMAVVMLITNLSGGKKDGLENAQTDVKYDQIVNEQDYEPVIFDKVYTPGKAKEIPITELSIPQLFSGVFLYLDKSVYSCDLNEDGYPEYCVTVQYGSGWVDSRIIAADWKNGMYYSLSNRFRSNYGLTLSDEGDLLVCESGHPEPTGRLVLANGVLASENFDDYEKLRSVPVKNDNNTEILILSGSEDISKPSFELPSSCVPKSTIFTPFGGSYVFDRFVKNDVHKRLLDQGFDLIANNMSKTVFYYKKGCVITRTDNYDYADCFLLSYWKVNEREIGPAVPDGTYDRNYKMWLDVTPEELEERFGIRIALGIYMGKSGNGKSFYLYYPDDPEPKSLYLDYTASMAVLKDEKGFSILTVKTIDQPNSTGKEPHLSVGSNKNEAEISGSRSGFFKLVNDYLVVEAELEETHERKLFQVYDGEIFVVGNSGISGGFITQNRGVAKGPKYQ